MARPTFQRGEPLRSAFGKALTYGDANAAVVNEGRANYAAVRADYARGAATQDRARARARNRSR